MLFVCDKLTRIKIGQKMIEVIILGIISGLIFQFIGNSAYKTKYKYEKNKIAKKMDNGTVERNDLIAMLNYHTNVKKAQGEGLKNVDLAEEKFADDRKVNEAIFAYYIKTRNFKKALNKIEQQLEKTPNDADAIFAKGICLFKLGNTDEAMIYRDKAIKIDQSFSNRNYS